MCPQTRSSMKALNKKALNKKALSKTIAKMARLQRSLILLRRRVQKLISRGVIESTLSPERTGLVIQISPLAIAAYCFFPTFDEFVEQYRNV